MRDVGYRQQFCNGLEELMNPPFANNRDIRHIRLAWSMLRRAGASSRSAPKAVLPFRTPRPWSSAPGSTKSAPTSRWQPAAFLVGRGGSSGIRSDCAATCTRAFAMARRGAAWRRRCRSRGMSPPAGVRRQSRPSGASGPSAPMSDYAVERVQNGRWGIGNLFMLSQIWRRMVLLSSNSKSVSAGLCGGPHWDQGVGAPLRQSGAQHNDQQRIDWRNDAAPYGAIWTHVSCCQILKAAARLRR